MSGSLEPVDSLGHLQIRDLPDLSAYTSRDSNKLTRSGNSSHFMWRPSSSWGSPLFIIILIDQIRVGANTFTFVTLPKVVEVFVFIFKENLYSEGAFMIIGGIFRYIHPQYI